MKLLSSVVFILVLVGCATVGPVSVEPDDTLFTIGMAFSLAILVFLVKGYIEYLFAKKLERYKKRLADSFFED